MQKIILKTIKYFFIVFGSIFYFGLALPFLISAKNDLICLMGWVSILGYILSLIVLLFNDLKFIFNYLKGKGFL